MSKTVRQLLPFGSLVLIICVLSAIKPDTFLTSGNFINVLRRSSINGIIAVGMTAVIISAGIDLSVGSIVALSGIVAGYTMVAIGGENPQGSALIIGSVAGIVTGILAGMLNGTLITKLNLPPFIVTLGSMSMFRGAAYYINDGQPINVPNYTYLNEAIYFGVPVSIIIFALILAIAAFVLRYTRLGRYTYAIGSNRQAAFHSGINVDFNLISIYTITGMVAGIAALITTSRAVSAQPTAGIALELDIIAAVVIGGASLSGGRGSITGTIVGTLMISFLRNGCLHLGISPFIQLIVIGAIIIAAVSVDQIARSKAASTQAG
ncbi:MAG: ABC transporter permease [Planctomycetes bacterium]|nr:ABC transporter permease [Planctomycetota bacterium]